MRTVFVSGVSAPRALGVVAVANLLLTTLAGGAGEPAPMPVGQAQLASAPPRQSIGSETGAGTSLPLRTFVATTHLTRVAFEQNAKRQRALRAPTPLGVPTVLLPAGGGPPPPPPPPPATEVVRAPLFGTAQHWRADVVDTSRGTPLNLRLLPDELPSEQLLASAPRRRFGINIGADTSRSSPRPLLAQFSGTSVAGRLRLPGLADSGKFGVNDAAGRLTLRGASSFVPQSGAITDVAGRLTFTGLAPTTKIGLAAISGRVEVRAQTSGQNTIVPTYDQAGVVRLLGMASGYKLGDWAIHGVTTGQRRPDQRAARRRPKQS